MNYVQRRNNINNKVKELVKDFKNNYNKDEIPTIIYYLMRKLNLTASNIQSGGSYDFLHKNYFPPRIGMDGFPEYENEYNISLDGEMNIKFVEKKK